MMLTLIGSAFCLCGVALLFRELKLSDRTTADKLRATLAEGAATASASSEA